jgi:uncharacterized SAM-binding protein YcdF (DUF218 family)
MKTLAGFIRFLIVLFLVLAGPWFLGLIIFANQVEDFDAAQTDISADPTEAIIVLTGGSERVATGVDLLKNGKGKKLFISGVHQGLTLDQILVGITIDDPLKECCISIGHAAESTQGNAEEVRNWMALQDYHSMRLVTANYHMPRSLMLFRRMLPDSTITPHPITPEAFKVQNWWWHSGTTDLLVTEYDKYLWAWLLIKLDML